SNRPIRPRGHGRARDGAREERPPVHPGQPHGRPGGRARDRVPGGPPGAAMTPEAPDALAERVREGHALLERTAAEFPYASVAAALGVGVVLGGGLPTWAVRLVVMSGARLAAARWVDAMARSTERLPAPTVAPA